ncbi:deoxyribonuclease IV [Candidatus Amesbacteria bacterium]|nr:deoxyribonuclease IV [Candidatus Amesbacteria bacterium]
MHLGAHVSIAGGFDKCLDRAVGLGANCLMTFASSPRSLSHKNFDLAQIKNYLVKKKLLEIGPHFFHAVYLVNLATGNKDSLRASTNSLIFYQRLAGEIGAVGTIFHIGSHKGQGLANCIDQIVQAVNFILDSSPKGTKLILENAAGQGGTIGENLQDLAQIIARVGDKPKISVCLDTQHAFAAGYNLDTILDKFDHTIGLKYLSVIHLNDSKTDFGSHVDRHANLGDGKIGLGPLKKFATDPRLKTIPLILEVPGSGSGPRKTDIDTLKSLVE